MPKKTYLFLFFICQTFLQCKGVVQAGSSVEAHEANKQLVPLGGNAWVTNGGKIDEKGLSAWENPQSACQIYFKINQTGKLHVSLWLNTNGGKSKISVTIFGKTLTIDAEGTGEKEYMVGNWEVLKTGYVQVAVAGISKTSSSFGTISNLGVSGNAIGTEIGYVKNNADNFFYWGRRGPSVHLQYNTENTANVEWFYNEITVPQGNDVMGSYFMANGFGEGYFGIQVNSPTERRVLFSVWSPFNTDNPAAIPPDQKIVLLKKGTDVYTGEFGNEGAGGQSYLKYNWKADNTYRFLLQGKPTADNYTVYTAYFFAPEENTWRLIASFKRPKTNTYLKGLHSFLENFLPETGNVSRMVYFDNQWVWSSNSGWKELTQSTFTGDNTARKKYRLDYNGGETNGHFFLKNCGFFNDNTTLDQKFSRPAKRTPPSIDFSKMP